MKQLILLVTGSIIANMFIYAGNDAVVVKTPEIITHCVPAENGNKLVVHFASLNKLGVFSLRERKFTNFIPVPSDILYTAGASKIIVASSTGFIMKYDLSGKRKQVAQIIKNGVIHGIEMGSGSEGPLLMRWADGSLDHDYSQYVLVDIEKMDRASKNIQGSHDYNRDTVHLRASSNGIIWSAWKSNTSDELERFAMMGGSVNHKNRSESFYVGPIAPGADGRYLYTQRGYYSSELILQSEELINSRSILIPGVTGSFFMAMVYTLEKRPGASSGWPYESLNVHITGDSTPFFNYKIDTGITGMISFDPNDWSSDFTLDRRIYLNPPLGLLVIIPDKYDKIVLFPLDVTAELDKSGKDYLLVTSNPKIKADPGSQYKYQVDVLSKKGGLNFKLESGPEGMKINPKGLVTWKVPDKYQSVSIIISISDSGGNSIYHTFEINIQ